MGKQRRRARFGLAPALVAVLAVVTVGGLVVSSRLIYRAEREAELRTLEVRALAAAGFGARIAADALAAGDLERLRAYAAEMVRNRPETWVAALVVDSSGAVLARGGRLPWALRELLENADLARGAPVWVPARGPRRWVVAAAGVPSASGGEAGRYVLVGRPSEDAPYLRILRRQALLAGGIVVVGFVLSIVAIRWLAAPIERLEAVVDRVREGDLTVRAEERAWGEAGRLARGVNAMLDRIEHLVTEVREAEARARRAEELRSLAHLGGGLAHEIKNPLTTVRLLLESMVRDVPPTAALVEVDRQDLELLATQVAKIDAVLEEFVRFARPRPLRPGWVDLSGAVGAVLEAQAVAARERGVRLQEFPGPPVRVRADRQRLEQALTNLVANAVAHSPAGGTVRVGWGAGEGRFTLWVEDQGEGIPEELRSRIFEPFFSKREGGMGLGLSIVRSAVLQHGWEIEVEETSAGGARFVIWGRTGGEEG